jgi:hypothetical protein
VYRPATLSLQTIQGLPAGRGDVADVHPAARGTMLATAEAMRRSRTTNNPWEPELLRLGRRLLRGAVATGTELAIGGLDSIECALTQAVTPVRNAPGLRLVTAAPGRGRSDCLSGE